MCSTEQNGIKDVTADAICEAIADNTINYSAHSAFNFSVSANRTRKRK